MFGCLRRLGCLVILLIAAAAYFTRAYWWGPARRAVDRTTTSGAMRDTASVWESLTPAAAERGERAVRSLAAPRGPAYASLRAGELASYLFLSLSAALPAMARDAQARVIDDRIYIRSVMSLRDVAGDLGPASGLLGERDTLRLGGTFEIAEPGRALFHVRDVQIGRVPLPDRAIPLLVRRLRPDDARTASAADALVVPTPPSIGDVRISRGRVTLYRRD